jgi:hypothetical protein
MIHDKYQHNQYQILKISLEHLESRIFQIFMKLGTKVEKIVVILLVHSFYKTYCRTRTTIGRLIKLV